MCKSNSVRLLFLSLLLLASLPSSTLYSQEVDKKVIVWQSELNELSRIINDLQISNESKQKLLEATIVTSTNLQISLTEAWKIVSKLQTDSAALLKLSNEINQTLIEHDKYWTEYRTETEAAIKGMQLEIKLWTFGTAIATGVAIGAVLFAIIPK